MPERPRYKHSAKRNELAAGHLGYFQKVKWLVGFSGRSSAPSLLCNLAKLSGEFASLFAAGEHR